MMYIKRGRGSHLHSHIKAAAPVDWAQSTEHTDGPVRMRQQDLQRIMTQNAALARPRLAQPGSCALYYSGTRMLSSPSVMRRPCTHRYHVSPGNGRSCHRQRSMRRWVQMSRTLSLFLAAATFVAGGGTLLRSLAETPLLSPEAGCRAAWRPAQQSAAHAATIPYAQAGTGCSAERRAGAPVSMSRGGGWRGAGRRPAGTQRAWSAASPRRAPARARGAGGPPQSPPPRPARLPGASASRQPAAQQPRGSAGLLTGSSVPCPRRARLPASKALQVVRNAGTAGRSHLWVLEEPAHSQLCASPLGLDARPQVLGNSCQVGLQAHGPRRMTSTPALWIVCVWVVRGRAQHFKAQQHGLNTLSASARVAQHLGALQRVREVGPRSRQVRVRLRVQLLGVRGCQAARALARLQRPRPRGLHVRLRRVARLRSACSVRRSAHAGVWSPSLVGAQL